MLDCLFCYKIDGMVFWEEKNHHCIFCVFFFLSSILSKVEFSSDSVLRNETKLFPANIWIFKFFFLIVFAIKMLLDKSYGLLNLLEFKCDHLSSLFQAESQF